MVKTVKQFRIIQLKSIIPYNLIKIESINMQIGISNLINIVWLNRSESTPRLLTTWLRYLFHKPASLSGSRHVTLLCRMGCWKTRLVDSYFQIYKSHANPAQQRQTKHLSQETNTWTQRKMETRQPMETAMRRYGQRLRSIWLRIIKKEKRMENTHSLFLCI